MGITTTLTGIRNKVKFQKEMFNNQKKVMAFLEKINISTNTLSAYIEKHGQTENEELLQILRQLIAIQEIFYNKIKFLILLFFAALATSE